MKGLVSWVAILSFFSLLFVSPVQADEDWVISDFSSTLTIQKDGHVNVVETIKVNFNSLKKHGIFRFIPKVYEDENGQKTYSSIDIISIQRNNTPEKYTTTDSGNFLEFKIGNPDKTISGEQVYEITYNVEGVLRGFESYDELYWNITGNDWPVKIEKAQGVLNLPETGYVQGSCYLGFVSATENCRVENSDPAFTFTSTRSLNEGEGLTIALGYKKGLVPLITVPKPQTIWDSLFKPSNIAIFLITFVLGIGFVIRLWYKKGRDFWIRRKYIDDPAARQEQKPLFAKNVVVVEFTPPEHLRPAEMGLLIDERADTLDVTATIVDLANRGFLAIKEEPKKWLFGSTDYTLTKVKTSAEDLLGYEEKLFESLFEGKKEVKISELRNSFYKDLEKVKTKLYQEGVTKKFFPEDPSLIRRNYTLGSIFIVIAGFAISFMGFILNVALLIAFASPFVVIGILALVVAQFMSKRTALGHELYIRSLGYKLFLERAEKYRQKFFERKAIFNEILPYAIMFGLTEKLAKAFDKMGLEPQKPNWYTGAHAFNYALFASNMNSFSTSVSQAIASTPSSSGSGGGGSSGGGFGGGGGGSW